MQGSFRSSARKLTDFCQRSSLSRFYATNLPRDTLQKWHLTGIPPPRSILDDDDSPVDLSEDNDLVNGIRPDTTPIHRRRPPKTPTPHEFAQHRKVMQRDFPDGWNPPRRLSREAMDGLRQLYRLDREKFSTPVLAEKFRISPEAVRRILKSRWQPSREKRVKQVEKEREGYAEYITLNRLRERMEADRLLELKRSTNNKGPEGTRGRIAGVNSKDRFTFE